MTNKPEERPVLTVEALDAMLAQCPSFLDLRRRMEASDRVDMTIVSPPLDASFLNRFPNLGAR